MPIFSTPSTEHSYINAFSIPEFKGAPVSKPVYIKHPKITAWIYGEKLHAVWTFTVWKSSFVQQSEHSTEYSRNPPVQPLFKQLYSYFIRYRNNSIVLDTKKKQLSQLTHRRDVCKSWSAETNDNWLYRML